MLTVIRNDYHCAMQRQEMARRQGKSHVDFVEGCLPRRTIYGSYPHAKKSSSVYTRIPRSEWPRLIKKGQGTWLSDIRKGKLTPHDQGSTPLCWAHGSVRSIEVLRIYQGQNPILLSAEQVAYEATGGRMRGGYPEEALDVLRKLGTCDQNLWPRNSLSVKKADPTYLNDRKNHVVIDWLDVENFDDQMTLALNRIPVPIGLGWWGHLVCQLDPIDFGDGTFGIGIDNSWGSSWGENGYGILHESKGTADLGAFAPISGTFSET